MITQPPTVQIHQQHEVWETRITVRPFVVNHRIGKDAADTLQRVRTLSEINRRPQGSANSKLKT